MEDARKCDCVDPNDGQSKCSGCCERAEESKRDDDGKEHQQAVDSAKSQQADDSAKHQQAVTMKSQIDSEKCDHFYADFYPFSM